MSQQIQGGTSYDVVVDTLRQHYVAARSEATAQDREVDISAARISQILSEPSFTLSPGSLMAIHGRIFDGLLADPRWEGRYRSENITKPEPALGGLTVDYTPWREIHRTLAWEFENAEERDPHDAVDAVNHVLQFASAIWQVHPFREGNTRTVAVYAIKYLRHLGVAINNEPFIRSAPYFRDALTLDNAPRALRDPQPLRLFGRYLTGESVTLPELRGSRTSAAS